MATKLTWRQRLAARIDPGRKKGGPYAVRRRGGMGRPGLGSAGARARAGGRKVKEGGVSAAGLSWMVQAPPTPEDDWRTDLLDDETLSRIDAKQLGEYLANLSPEASKALWDFLRLMNPGFTITALNRGGRRPYGRAQAALDAFLIELEAFYGPLDVVINRLMLAAWLRGAFLAELVLDEDGRRPLDIATPDPWAVRFRKVEDPARGEVWELGQYQGGKWVKLDAPTVRYIPVDPLPGAPYGRSLVAPALFSCLFLLGLLHDLRRVVSQQGYPRLDLAIALERLVSSMPENIQDEPEQVQSWVQAAVDQVSTVYASLEPDDAYVHTDVVTVNRPVGAMGSESLGAVDGLIRGIERMAIRALKTMPIFMASNEAVSETHARWQWEIQSAGIQALQHLAESLLGYLLGLALRVQGIDAVVEVRFAQLNEMLRKEKAETEKIEIENAARKRDEGWISQDEAALAVTGHEAVGAVSREGQVASGATGRRGTQVGGRLLGDEEGLPEVPDEVSFDEEDIDRVSGLWDEVMGDLGVDGLLEAEVEEGEGENGRGWKGGSRGREVVVEELFGVVMVRAGEETGWVWEARARRYRNRATGRFIGQEELRELRDVYVDRMTARSDRLAERLFNNEISVQQWTLEMRGLVKDAFAAQYMAARGGRNAMTQSDWGSVGRMVRDQYGWLQDFAGDLKAGKLTVGQARARAGLYMAASTQAFERGKQKSYGMPALPAYPGDGSTECRCITSPESRVLTRDGWKAMNAVRVGEEVWTHRGRWRRVLAKVVKPSEAGMRQVYVRAPGKDWVGATDTHLWLTQDGWRNATDIDSTHVLMYHCPVTVFAQDGADGQAILQAVSSRTLESEQARVVQGLPERVSLWQPEGFPGGRVYFLRDEPQGEAAVAGAARGDVSGDTGSASRTANTIRRLGLGDDELVFANGWATVHVDMGEQSQSDDLSLPVGVADGAWLDTAWVLHPSSQRRSNGRQVGESGDAVDSAAHTAAWAGVQHASAGNLGDSGMPAMWPGVPAEGAEGSGWPVLLAGVLSPGATGSGGGGCLDRGVPAVRGDVSAAAMGEVAIEVLLAGMLPEGTALFDLSVEEDHSFVVEGLVSHNTNCKCHWVIREFKDRWEATWTMSVLAEHCDDCLVNAAKWSPLVFRKDG